MPGNVPAMTTSRKAFDELLATLTEVADRFAGPEWGIGSPQDEAEALRLVLHQLATGLETQFEDDPAHPIFREIVTPWRKVLGDNPDARYHDAIVHPDGVYRVHATPVARSTCRSPSRRARAMDRCRHAPPASSTTTTFTLTTTASSSSSLVAHDVMAAGCP